MNNAKLSPSHHRMTPPRLADGGGGRQQWRVAANILNRQFQTAYRECSSVLGVGRGLNHADRKKKKKLGMNVAHRLRIGGVL
jgi:hypothetical protein